LAAPLAGRALLAALAVRAGGRLAGVDQDALALAVVAVARLLHRGARGALAGARAVGAAVLLGPRDVGLARLVVAAGLVDFHGLVAVRAEGLDRPGVLLVHRHGGEAEEAHVALLLAAAAGRQEDRRREDRRVLELHRILLRGPLTILPGESQFNNT